MCCRPRAWKCDRRRRLVPQSEPPAGTPPAGAAAARQKRPREPAQRRARSSSQCGERKPLSVRGRALRPHDLCRPGCKTEEAPTTPRPARAAGTTPPEPPQATRTLVHAPHLAIAAWIGIEVDAERACQGWATVRCHLRHPRVRGGLATLCSRRVSHGATETRARAVPGPCQLARASRASGTALTKSWHVVRTPAARASPRVAACRPERPPQEPCVHDAVRCRAHPENECAERQVRQSSSPHLSDGRLKTSRDATRRAGSMWRASGLRSHWWHLPLIVGMRTLVYELKLASLAPASEAPPLFLIVPSVQPTHVGGLRQIVGSCHARCRQICRQRTVN